MLLTKFSANITAKARFLTKYSVAVSVGGA